MRLEIWGRLDTFFKIKGEGREVYNHRWSMLGEILTVCIMAKVS